MSTFKEIAQEARTIAPSQSLGSVDYCRMIARLAEALDRLEYNTARALSRAGSGIMPIMSAPYWLDELRQEVPDADS